MGKKAKIVRGVVIGLVVAFLFALFAPIPIGRVNMEVPALEILRDDPDYVVERTVTFRGGWYLRVLDARLLLQGISPYSFRFRGSIEISGYPATYGRIEVVRLYASGFEYGYFGGFGDFNDTDDFDASVMLRPAMNSTPWYISTGFLFRCPSPIIWDSWRGRGPYTIVLGAETREEAVEILHSHGFRGW